MRLIETDTNANKDINAAVAVGAYTATTTRGVIVRLLADQVAGGGDYIAYVTVQLAGAGSHYRIIPLTTGTAAAALTAIGFVSIPIPVDTGDVLTVYIDGLAGDTTTPDVRVDFYEQDYLRPTTADRTLDVSATGEAGVDWANVGTPGSTVALTNTQINSVLGTVNANVTQIDGDPDPVDNLVLALGNSSGVMISNAAVDAVWDEAIAGHLTAGTTGAKLNTAAAGSGSGSTAYTDTVTDDSSNPLDGVEVWITSDSGGASTVASTTTNTLGSFTVYLDPGTYYLWLAKGGYNFPNPTTITVT